VPVSPRDKRLIKRIVNVFETGSPDGRYDALVVMADGKNQTRQITYGCSQTTEQSNLKQLLTTYIEAGGAFADACASYVERIGAEPLADDEKFKRLLRRCAREDPLMRHAQDDFFDRTYWRRAEDWFERGAFDLPLSMLVVYDSHIHSGSVPVFLRRRFIEPVPARGGSERRWTRSYVESRHQWLKHHRNPLLRTTIYRTQTFLHEIAADNWQLARLPIRAHGVDVYDE
jgi:chitosanase